MRRIELGRATDSLAEYAGSLRRDPIVFTRGGRPVAALLSIENADPKTLSLSTNPLFLRLIRLSRARQRTEGGLSSAEMKRRLRLRCKASR